MAQLLPGEELNMVLAWYYMLGSWGAAIGTVTMGWLVQALKDRAWLTVDAYRVVFYVYAAQGLLKFILSLLLSQKCEDSAAATEPITDEEGIDNERTPLLPGYERAKPRMATISTDTRYFVAKFCSILVLDNIGSGLAANSWLTYIIDRKFAISAGLLGTIFSSSHFLASLSNVLAVPIVRRMGLIKTMFFGHAIASTALLLLPFPEVLTGTVVLLFVRSTFLDFDQAPRQTFLSQSVQPEERTAIMGIVNTVRTLSQGMGLGMAGYLGDWNYLDLAPTLAGGLKLVYDVLLLILFVDFPSTG